MKILGSHYEYFTAYWFRYPNGIEGESTHMQSKVFYDPDSAISFITTKSERTRGIYWAGAYVEDTNGNIVYTITSDYEHIMN